MIKKSFFFFFHFKILITVLSYLPGILKVFRNYVTHIFCIFLFFFFFLFTVRTVLYFVLRKKESICHTFSFPFFSCALYNDFGAQMCSLTLCLSVFRIFCSIMVTVPKLSLHYRMDSTTRIISLHCQNNIYSMSTEQNC